MNGGYVMVDCKGLNLLAQSSQTVNGLYEVCKDAYNSGKPIIAYNCVYGTGVPLTPIQVFAIEEAGKFIFTSSILQIIVDDDDSVVIASLLV